MRLLDQPDDLQLFGSRISHSSSAPSAIMLFFLSRRNSRACRDVWCVIAQKRPPALARRSALAFHHVLCDSGLSDLEAELQKLAMDARRAPERVIKGHLPD